MVRNRWNVPEAVTHVRIHPVKHLLQQAAQAAHKNVSEFLLDAGIVAGSSSPATPTPLHLFLLMKDIKAMVGMV